ncbi:hypothetical protein H4R21_001798 [Coemansia helicoidea]|uniref:Uncharacterized protein n=1 Tax=Coemansia helicoidea TaxID=1286919 RepID=A0ACC1L9D5_9FUNG|nr:hypothetical protein H4R21_001798 [Coemansia helicoidea]
MTTASEQEKALVGPADGADASPDAESKEPETAAAASKDTPVEQASADSCSDTDEAPVAANTRPGTSRSTVAGDAAGPAADEAGAAGVDSDDEGGELVVERPRVQVYGSTVSGNRTYKKQAKELFMMLEACEVDFEFICIAADEQAKRYVRRKALGNMTIPQVYVDGEFRGFYDDAFKANEMDELYEWLGLDEDPVDY